MKELRLVAKEKSVSRSYIVTDTNKWKQKTKSELAKSIVENEVSSWLLAKKTSQAAAEEMYDNDYVYNRYELSLLHISEVYAIARSRGVHVYNTKKRWLIEQIVDKNPKYK